GLVIRVVDAGAGGAVLVADGARADASVPGAVGGEDGEVLPAGELVGAAGRAIGAAGGIVAKVLAGVVQGRTQRRTVAAAGAEQAAEPGIARAALENAVVAVFDRDVVVAAVPDGPVTDPDIVAELGEGGAGAGLGHLHAGAVVGEPGCVVLQLLAQAAAGDGVDQGAVAPVPAAAAATDRQRDGVLDPQVDVIEVSRQPQPPGTGSGVGRRAGLFGAAAPLVADRGAVWGVQTQADAAVPVVGRRRDRASGAEVEVVVQRSIVVDVVPGIDLGVGAHLHAGAAAVHQFAAHDVGRAVHMVDLVAVVVGAVAKVG